MAAETGFSHLKHALEVLCNWVSSLGGDVVGSTHALL